MSLEKEIAKRYEITKTIGSGAFAIVYKAFDKKSKINCALKIIDKNKVKENFIMDYDEEEIEKKKMKYLIPLEMKHKL